MTVKELIQELQGYPENMLIATWNNEDGFYETVEDCYQTNKVIIPVIIGKDENDNWIFSDVEAVAI